MQTVLCVIGTRPEAIKMAPVVLELRRRPTQFRTLVCATGQHRHMLDQALRLFDIRPDFDLDAMRPDQTLSGLAALLLQGLDGVIVAEQPDWVVAQGDTTTVLAAALAAYHRQVKFGHVEAGLRTGDKLRPFPEEVNRRIADVVADAYFAPTEHARQTLLAEGAPPAAVHVTGNTVIDALLDIAARPVDWRQSPWEAAKVRIDYFPCVLGRSRRYPV